MLLSFSVLLTLAVTPILGDDCPKDYEDINGRCFRYEKHKRSYEDAQEDCRSEGANLAWITDYTDVIAVVDAFDLKYDFWMGARRVLCDGEDNDDKYYDDDDKQCIVRPDGQKYPISDVGFWGKDQPKDKKDYECVMLKSKKGKGKKSKGKHKHKHGYDDSPEGLEWELKKCKDKKSYLCELRCEAGEFYCGGVGCVTSEEECYENPPTQSCDDVHDFSVDGVTFKNTGYSSGKYPENSVCVYQLSIAEGFILRLEFDVFLLGTDDQDFIEIYVGSTVVADAEYYGRFSNHDNLVNRVVFSTNNQMVIILNTDGRTERDGRGFSVTSVEFTQPPSVEEEIITLVAGGGMQYITSPGFDSNIGELPSYSASWRIEVSLFTQIIIELDVDTRLDEDSVLEILGVLPGEEYAEIAVFQGKDVKFVSFISTTNICVLRYKTGKGAHWSSRGFKIGVAVLTSTDNNCQQVFSEDAGIVSSPGYGLVDSNGDSVAYPVNYACTYTITVSSNDGNFSFWFDNDFGIDEEDSLKISNEELGREINLAGYVDISTPEFPSKQYTAFGTVTLEFMTNAVTDRKTIEGFKLSYSKDCPLLEVTEWTRLSQILPDNNDLDDYSTRYQYGHIVEIVCESGYEFQDDFWTGSMTAIECLWGGLWNVSRIPQCQPVYCGLPPAIISGYAAVSSGVLFGDVVTYECFDGLNLLGNENSTCQADKTWSTPPRCSEVNCTLEQPGDGIASHVLRSGTAEPISNSSYNFGAVVELECIDGYKVVGVTSIYCNQEFDWSGELGTCERIHCPFVPVMDGIMTDDVSQPDDLEELISNHTYFYQLFTDSLTYIPQIEFEDNATVWCKPGYVINNTESQSSNVSCGADRTFGDVPVCVDYDECETNTSSCEMHCHNTPGSYYCSCDEEYQLLDNGTCILIPGCEANSDACDQKCNSTTLPQWFECSCDPPYVLYNELGAEGWHKHTNDTADQILRVNQSCVLKQCSLEDIREQLMNSTLILSHVDDATYPLHFNDSVTVLCARGYTYPDGNRSKEFHCTFDGWQDMDGNNITQAECSEEVICPAFNLTVDAVSFTTPHVQICSYPFNYEIVSSCDLDPITNEYVLSSDVLCPVVDCGPPDQEQTLGGTNLTVDCTTLNCSFEFRCDGGKEPLPLGVSTTITCMADGKWNYSSIYCEGTSCQDPGTVFGTYRSASGDMSDNRTISLSNLKSGGKIYYDCINPGYTLSSGGTPVEYISCDGSTFSPNVSTFECIDSESPAVPYCPPQIEVFRFHGYQEAPFDADGFMGYGSPLFTDNAGIKEIVIQPYTFHSRHIFSEDLNVSFTAYDFIGSSTSCSIQFIVVDPTPPAIQCGTIYVATNASTPEVVVTDEMILSAVVIDASSAYEYVEVEMSTTDRTVNTANALDMVDRIAVVRVHRVFYSGDVSMGMNRTNNITQTAECHVVVLPQPDLCDLHYAPSPGGADRTCMELENGTKECNYTCQQPSGLFFQFSGNLENTATSTCSNSSIGYTPVYDCVESGLAGIFTAHLVLQVPRPSTACVNAFTSGYKDWFLNDYCQGAVDDIVIYTKLRGSPVDISTTVATNNALMTATPTIVLIPKSGEEGTEILCTGSEDLSVLNSCLSGASSSIDPIQFFCENADYSPIQTVQNNVTIYSCFNCPAGTFFDEGECKACPIGTFLSSPGANTLCEECPEGYTTIEEGGACKPFCEEGYVSDTGVYPCSPCPVNHYSVNNTHCEMCPSGTKGRSNAQSSSDSCKPKCAAGTYSYDGYVPDDGECRECPVNFFQSDVGATECIRCNDTDHTNSLTGQTECTLFYTDCPNDVRANCSNSFSCDVKDGLFFCSLGCEDNLVNHGSICNLPTTPCISNSCDPRGTVDCVDGKCVCNSEIAEGEFCEVMRPAPTLNCENGGEAFAMVDGYSPGANILHVCLCGGPWSGENCTEIEDKCDASPAPCVDGQFAECVSEDVRARCECTMGYTGYDCNTEIDGCISSPCMNGGTCSDVPGDEVVDSAYEFTCMCPPGFSGDSCQDRKDECEEISCGDFSSMCVDEYESLNSTYCFSVFFKKVVNVSVSISTTSYCEAHDIECENDGECEDVSGLDRYRCVCSDIYDGQHCQHRIDFCEDDPCGNGACSNKDDEAGYTCNCTTGYIFDDMTCVDVDECEKDDDLCNTGDCMNTDGSYYCMCDEEHAGKHCETNINECLTKPCNGEFSVCLDSDTHYECICQTNLTGDNCYEEKNLCEDQCQGGSTCHSVFGSYVCQCKMPSYGRHCENTPNICEVEKPCVYGGVCENVDNSFTCVDCDSGFYGDACELWINECIDNPCENGGSCELKRVQGYTCSCPPGFIGDHCETKLDPCSSDPCIGSATCVNQGFYDYKCVCPPGRVGAACDTVIDADFDFYLKLGEYFVILEPTISAHWTVTRFTLSTWVRLDRTEDKKGFIDFLQVTVEGEAVLRLNANRCMYNGKWYNIRTNPSSSLSVGYWAFYAVSVNTVDGQTTLSISTDGIAIDYILDEVPEEKAGRLNIEVSPDRNFVGYCSQTYLWAGAAFTRSELDSIRLVPRGEVIEGSQFKVEFLHYFWAAGLFRTSPFCEVARPTKACIICDDDSIGTFLEFERECPKDKVVTTSARSVQVTWDPPLFLLNGEAFTANTPNILPGTELGLGKHKVRYSASKNGKTLKCDFNIYVRFGCEGIVYNSRCIRPQEQTGITKAEAEFRCKSFGGVPVDIVDGDVADNVAGAIVASKYEKRELIVGSHVNGSSDPQCVFLSSSTDVLKPLECTQAIGVVCGRPISSAESCVLPRIPSNVKITQVISNSSLLKYKIECKDADARLPSYAPKEITCYPEGNWDTNFGFSLPSCVSVPVNLVPVFRRIRYRVKIRMSFRFRMTNPCRSGGTYNTYNILFAVRNVLFGLRNRYFGFIRVGRRSSLSLCCDDPRNCDTSSSCGLRPFALSCRCGLFGGKRRKRNTDEENENEIDVNLDEIELDPDDIDLSAEEILTAAVANGEFTNNITNSGFNVLDDEPVLSSLEIAQEPDCPEGFEVVDDECEPCPEGTYWTTNGTCEFCDFNFYQPDINATECIPCDGDNVTYNTGAASADECAVEAPAGSFYNEISQTLELCPRGTYQSEPGQLSCEPCPPSTNTPTNGSTSADQCEDECPSGSRYSSADGICISCEIGYYRDEALDVTCVKCPDGLITAMEGAVSEDNCTIADCDIGEYRNETVNVCMGCPRGTFQNETRQTECMACGGNETTMATNSTSPSECKFICPDGYEEAANSSCSLCEVGSYRTKDIDNIANKMCTECDGYWTTAEEGSVTESQCSILACPEGLQANSTMDGCEECPVGTYSDGYTNATQSCSACDSLGHYTTNSTGKDSADDCFLSCPNAGEETNRAGNSCVPCMQGYYAESGDQICSSCNTKDLEDGVVRWDTTDEGSISVDNCTVAFCAAGYKRDNSTSPQMCVECPTGFYQDQNGSLTTVCTPCPLTASNDNQTTNANGSTSLEDCRVTCPPGQQDINDTCQQCPMGTYKEMAGPETCTPCGFQLTTNLTGSSNESDCNIAICDKGYYANGTNCTECPVGFYQEEEMFTGSDCTPCSSIKGYPQTTSSTGSTSEDACEVVCSPGYAKNETLGCTICPVDTYDNGTNYCVPCDDSFSTNDQEGGVDSSACNYKRCGAGEQTMSTNTSACEPCPRNTYNDMAGGTCMPCNGSKETISTGSDSVDDCITNCPSGQEHNSVSDSCELCPRGYYRDMASGTYYCEECHENTTNTEAGSASCNVEICGKGQYAKEDSGVYTCTDCEIGKYQADRGQFECVSCGEGYTTEEEGSKDEQSCVSIPTCENKSPCTHQKHSCEVVNGAPVCSCPTAYTQQQVGETYTCTHICSETSGGSFCQNNGVCNDYVDDLLLACTCTDGWAGTNCTTEAAGSRRAPRTTLIIVGVVSGVVLLAVIGAAAYAFCKGSGKPKMFTEKMYLSEPQYLDPTQVAGIPIYNTHHPNRLMLRDVEEFSPRGRPLHDSYVIQ